MTQRDTRDDSESVLAHVLVTMMVHGMLLVGLVILFVMGVPKFRAWIEVFNCPTGTVTNVVFAVSHFTRHYVIVVLPVVAVLLVGDALFLARLLKHARPIWSFVWSVGICGLIGLGYLTVLTQSHDDVVLGLLFVIAPSAVDIPLDARGDGCTLVLCRRRRCAAPQLDRDSGDGQCMGVIPRGFFSFSVSTSQYPRRSSRSS